MTDLVDEVEEILYAENHATLCNCKQWPTSCVNGLTMVPFTLSDEDVLRVALPMIGDRIVEAFDSEPWDEACCSCPKDDKLYKAAVREVTG